MLMSAPEANPHEFIQRYLRAYPKSTQPWFATKVQQNIHAVAPASNENTIQPAKSPGA